MLLSELEPGTEFTLTDATVKAETARLIAAGISSTSADRLSAGPYQVLTPQRMQFVEFSNGLSRVYPPELYTMGKWFVPSVNVEYEVEIVPTKMGDDSSPFPSRTWLFTSVDPEVFIEKDGQIVPGFAVLPSKKNPGYANEGNGIFHEDGFQGEFSPNAVACHETLAYSMSHAINAMMEHVNSKFREWNDPSKFVISDATFVELTPELLAMGTDDQVALGCDTSENVWGHPAFSAPNGREFPYRMAGGHIHLGKTVDAKWFHSRAERIIKAMDVFLGVPSVALLAGIEDPRRRQYYGRAGEFRFQKHGLEYRVLSNAYLQHPALTHLVLNLARGAFRVGTSNWESQFQYDPELVRHIINEHDVVAAQKFVADNAKLLMWIMDKDSGQGWGAKALSTIHNGAKSVFDRYLGIQKTWVEDSRRYEPQQFHRFVAQHAIQNWPSKQFYTSKEVGTVDRYTLPVAQGDRPTASSITSGRPMPRFTRNPSGRIPETAGEAWDRSLAMVFQTYIPNTPAEAIHPLPAMNVNVPGAGQYPVVGNTTADEAGVTMPPPLPVPQQSRSIYDLAGISVYDSDLDEG